MQASRDTQAGLMSRAASSSAPAALFKLAAALAQAGEGHKAAEAFRRAYLLQPSIRPLMRKNFSRAPEDIRNMRDYAALLVRHDVTYSAVIAALAVAEAHMAHEGEVRRLVDYDRFFSRGFLQSPVDGELSEFNDALAAEIKPDLKYYDAPAGRAIRRAWRHDRIMDSSLPALSKWACAIRCAIDRYMSSIPPDPDHPFSASRPADYVIEAWALVSDGDSFHVPHIHPRAWMSGVYYVARPEISRNANSRDGWLHVGAPAMHGLSADDGWAGRVIAPEPGSFVMMPAYFYHWTYPMAVAEERVCLVFDVVPVELASQDSEDDDH